MEKDKKSKRRLGRWLVKVFECIRIVIIISLIRNTEYFVKYGGVIGFKCFLKRVNIFLKIRK